MGHIFYQWSRPLEQIDSKVEICSTCHLSGDTEKERNRLILVGNFLSGQCSKSHDLSIFFESNKIPFICIDPCNGHLNLEHALFLDKHSLALEPVRLPRIWIHGQELNIKKVYEFAAKGLLLAIIRG